MFSPCGFFFRDPANSLSNCRDFSPPTHSSPFPSFFCPEACNERRPLSLSLCVCVCVYVSLCVCVCDRAFTSRDVTHRACHSAPRCERVRFGRVALRGPLRRPVSLAGRQFLRPRRSAAFGLPARCPLGAPTPHPRRRLPKILTLYAPVCSWFSSTC